METDKRRFSISKRWFLYAEIIAIIGFLVLAFIHTRRGGAIPDSPPVTEAARLIEQADIDYENQNLGRAVYLYWQALYALESDKSEENKSERLHVNLRIADIYSQSNWLKDAKSRLQHASYIQPDHEDVLLWGGKFYRDEGELGDATEQFLKVLEQNPNHPEALYLLGVLYQGNKQYEEASKHYLRAIENDPDFIKIPTEKAPIGILARLQLSRTYNKMFQNYRMLDRELTSEDMTEISRLENQSILLLEEALQHDQNNPEIIDGLTGLLYRRAEALKREAATRPYADAIEVYERIVELDPNEVKAWQDMAEIYESFLFDKQKALEMYQKVYELEPHATFLAIIRSLEEDIAAENAEVE